MRDTLKYTIAFLIVLGLQYASFGLHYTNIPRGGTTLCILLVAGVMVTVSALVFMELRRSSAATRIVGLLAVLFVALLCLGVAGDVAYR